jgi:nucleotide-binding universal stress UspA family protein
MQTLIVPLDGSEFAERALPVAAGLARRFDGDVLAVTSKWDDHLDAPAEYLRDVEARTPGISTLLVRDQSAAGAIEFAVHDGTDRTVCMTSHGRGGLRWAVLGSVAEAVIQRVPEPMLLVGRHCDPERVDARDMVVCWDGSDASNALLTPACAWAKALDVGVHLVFVAHSLDVETVEHPGELFAQAVEKIEAESVPVDAHILRSSYAAGMISDFASARRVALIATASHARTGLARVVVGSTTMGVVGSAPCPVLVAPPSR